MKIGVVNTKGGVGKTTTTVYLAAAARQRGLTVEVQDLDKQASAMSWLAELAVDGITVTPGNKFTVERSSAADVVLFDTSPGDQRDVAMVAQAADFVVVPSAPGALNDERTITTAQYLSEQQVSYAVVLVQRDDRTLATRESRTALLDFAPVFETEIPLRESIRRAPNTWPSELHGYAELFAEIEKEVRA